jgi:hypothetical protein
MQAQNHNHAGLSANSTFNSFLLLHTSIGLCFFVRIVFTCSANYVFLNKTQAPGARAITMHRELWAFVLCRSLGSQPMCV